jgi:hypothetical protein
MLWVVELPFWAKFPRVRPFARCVLSLADARRLLADAHAAARLCVSQND